MKPFVQDFDLKAKIPEQFVGAFSIYLFGIMFAPYWAPHVTERIGRSASYFIYITINALFNLGVGFSKSTGSVLVCRFFAGFFGGPALVVIEGMETSREEQTMSYGLTIDLNRLLCRALACLLHELVLRRSGHRFIYGRRLR